MCANTMHTSVAMCTFSIHTEDKRVKYLCKPQNMSHSTKSVRSSQHGAREMRSDRGNNNHSTHRSVAQANAQIGDTNRGQNTDSTELCSNL